MRKKIMLSMLAVMTALTVQAQIGYKGQVTAAIDGGITHLGGFVGSARIGAYLSPHSVLGGGVMFDKTRYDATLGDSFDAAQWLGEIHYQYAVALNRFVLLPSGGLLLGGESCDRLSRQGNLLPYQNQFMYGLFAEFGVEYVFGRHWAVAVNPRLQYLMKTNFDSWKLSGSVGLKYYF